MDKLPCPELCYPKEVVPLLSAGFDSWQMFSKVTQTGPTCPWKPQQDLQKQILQRARAGHGRSGDTEENTWPVQHLTCKDRATPAPVPAFLSSHRRQAAFQPAGEKAGEAERGNESQEGEESICNETFIDVQVSALKENQLLPLAGLPAAAQPQPSLAHKRSDQHQPQSLCGEQDRTRTGLGLEMCPSTVLLATDVPCHWDAQRMSLVTAFSIGTEEEGTVSTDAAQDPNLPCRTQSLCYSEDPQLSLHPNISGWGR